MLRYSDGTRVDVGDEVEVSNGGGPLFGKVTKLDEDGGRVRVYFKGTTEAQWFKVARLTFVDNKGEEE